MAVSSRVAPGTPYYDFQQADRKFRSDEPHVNPREGFDSVDRMYLNLAEFETFVWGGVTALSECNREDSRLNMTVASTFLKQAHKNYNGIVDSSWNPPDITGQETNAVKCAE